jgi:curli production assembly/transport component CsgE
MRPPFFVLRHLNFLLLALVLALSAWPCAAGDDPDGLTINQTVTRFGQVFYNEFVKHWNDYSHLVSANLTVYERPSARWGSLIWIEYRGRRIFQRQVGPSIRVIEEMAKTAAAESFSYVLNQQNTLGVSPDDLEATEAF